VSVKNGTFLLHRVHVVTALTMKIALRIWRFLVATTPTFLKHFNLSESLNFEINLVYPNPVDHAMNETSCHTKR
jgi:hypothetical protein